MPRPFNLFFLAVVLGLAVRPLAAAPSPLALEKLASPVIFAGDARTAYRDPAVVYHAGVFHLYFTLVQIDDAGLPFLHTAWSRSTNLQHWTPPVIFTPHDRALNFSSPGNVVRHGDQWLLCLQTYPRPAGEAYGNADSRLYLRRSLDLESWSAPELIRVKGPAVSLAAMGRMIDPCLVPDLFIPGKWWCFYKQNGASMSWSTNLTDWQFFGRVEAGENVCVIQDLREYLMFHSPANGIGRKRSRDLRTWQDEGLLRLGQSAWPWAKGRLTAGFVLDLRAEPGIGKAFLFFHGSAFPEKSPQGGFDNHASLALAWSDDLESWRWPGPR